MASSPSRPVCISCGAAAVETLLALGPQPPSNRYVPVGAVQSDAHPLNFGHCVSCGMLQLADPMPAAMVRSRKPGLKYGEPEGHLDALAAHLAGLVGPDARILGLTYNDDSTLARLNGLGRSRTRRLEMAADLGITDRCAGFETVQAVVDDGMVRRLTAKYGTADLVIVRYLLEHAHAPSRLLAALGGLLAPGGRIVIELPDCRKFIAACDYSFIWEEHIGYYTPRAITALAHRNGFGQVETLLYPYAFEDALVAIMQSGPSPLSPLDAADAASDRSAAHRFAGEFDRVRERYHRHFDECRVAGKRIAIFGAGHLAATFLNVLGLGGSVECVIDDNPDKTGLGMPGSGVPIVGSSRLGEIDLCLLALSPASETKVLAHHGGRLAPGGRFASIFALSPIALTLP